MIWGNDCQVVDEGKILPRTGIKAGDLLFWPRVLRLAHQRVFTGP